METKEKYCENCGDKLSEDDLFCPACGEKCSEVEVSKSVKYTKEIVPAIKNTDTIKNVSSTNNKKLIKAIITIMAFCVIAITIFLKVNKNSEKTEQSNSEFKNNVEQSNNPYGARFNATLSEFEENFKSKSKDLTDGEITLADYKNSESTAIGLSGDKLILEEYIFKNNMGYSLEVMLEDESKKVFACMYMSEKNKESAKQEDVASCSLAALTDIDLNRSRELLEYIYSQGHGSYNYNNILVKYVEPERHEDYDCIAIWSISTEVLNENIEEVVPNVGIINYITDQSLKENSSKPVKNITDDSYSSQFDENLSLYIGNWQDSDNDVYEKGGTLLEIKSIENKDITFSLTKVFSNGNVLTFVDDINAIIENNEADFTYTDSRGNSGEGTLKFKDNTITAILTTTQKGEDSTYAADTNAILHKSDASLQQNSVNTESNEYIFPDSNVRYLSESEVMAIDPSLLVYARNEIFARHGRMFDDPEVKSYFESKSWYNGTIPGAEFDSTVVNSLNDYEKANVEVIKNVEVLQKDFEGQRNWNGV